jgi:hypothetical protein
MTGLGTGTTMARIDRPEELQMSHSTRRHEVTLQTVRLGKGRHNAASEGACVMELASMLAGEPFSDHPRAVCPVIAGFLRRYNDQLPDGQQDELYAYASLAVGTSGSRSARRARARRLLEWAGEDMSARRPLRWRPRLFPWDTIVQPVVEFAVGMPPAQRRRAVGRLLEELVAIGPRHRSGMAPVAAPPAVRAEGRDHVRSGDVPAPGA